MAEFDIRECLSTFLCIPVIIQLEHRDDNQQIHKRKKKQKFDINF